VTQSRRVLRTFTVRDPVFRATIHMCVGPYLEFAEWYRCHYKDNTTAVDGPEPLGKMIELINDGCDGVREWFLWFPSTRAESQTVGHECLHAVIHILNDRGVRFAPDSEEVYTYYLSFLIREVEKFFNRLDRPKKTAINAGSSLVR